ncbi:MAG: signal peptide-containing protein [Planctomycetota bacterium]
MLRFAKYAIATLLVVGIGGFFVFGRAFPSYVISSANSVSESVKETVPVEFELRRARDLIKAILPELQAQVRAIAEEEVAIAALEAEINESDSRLKGEFATLSSLRDKMRVQQVSYRSGGRDWTRAQLTEQLARRFDRYKQGQITLESKQALLDNRNESLNAALASLESMRHRKVELEQKVEALAAQARMVQSARIESGLQVDSSGLSEADRLLADIETRLNVAHRVLEHENNLFEVTVPVDAPSEAQVLMEYDEYFGSEPEANTMVSSDIVGGEDAF